MTKNPLKITDVTLRDGHQSSLATRMRTEDMEGIAEEMNKAGFYSMEVWGGATFDVPTRFLNEDPWERPRILKRLIPDTPLQMLLRGQNLVGYRNYPDDVVTAFVYHAAEVGIDIFRVFDAVNDERNFETSLKAIKERGKHAQLSLCYSLTEPKLGGPVYNIEYYVNKALILQDMGADSLCIKDMAGLIAPDDAYELINNNIRIVCEGANMPCTPEAVDIFQDKQILYAPSKAANAGGIAVSGLEMVQNSQRLNWLAKEVDDRLQIIMKGIHQTCLDVAREYGTPGNYLNGANIAGFVKVVEAMLDQGVV